MFAWPAGKLAKMIRFLVTFCLLLATSAFARDGYGDGRPTACDMPSGPRLEACQQWISTVQRPDLPASCCGEGDFFIADDFAQENGQLVAIISVDYPDVGEVKGLKRGDRIVIPPEKINSRPEDANHSPHGGPFIHPGTHEVLCYFFPPLI